jgi:very-short-patch-repair endonuclease/predicted transcriptional regulator of viral defense system
MTEERRSDSRQDHRIDGPLELVDRQHGVVAHRQLLALGLSPTMIARRVRDGRLLGMHRGVYAVGHKRLRREGFWLAAVLAGGAQAALSHRSAAALHGIRDASGASVDVTVPASRRAQAGIRFHRAMLTPEDLAVVEGIPTTTVARTLVDLASVVPTDHLAKAIDTAERLRLLDLTGIEETLDRTRGRKGPGHAALRRALAEHRTTLTRSDLEDRFLRLVTTSGLPLPQTNVQIQGFEVDAFWPKRRLVVELDGWAYHRTAKAFQRDRTKANALTKAGYRVLRFTHDDIANRPAQVVRDLR